MKNQSSIRCIKDSAGCDVSTTFSDIYDLYPDDKS